jgi:hypothetical protein
MEAPGSLHHYFSLQLNYDPLSQDIQICLPIHIESFQHIYIMFTHVGKTAIFQAQYGPLVDVLEMPK